MYTLVYETVSATPFGARLLFGFPSSQRRGSSPEQGEICTHVFEPARRFGIELWAQPAHGRGQRQCVICETTDRLQDCTRVPWVSPGAQVLLRARGAARVARVLTWLGALREGGVDLLTCPKETFLAAQFRLEGAQDRDTSAHRLGAQG